MASPGRRASPRAKLLLALFVLALSALPAAGGRLPVQTYTTADGLPSDRVIDLLEDTHGFLWVATSDGLARFDGYTFTSYGPESGLPDTAIYDLLLTRGGELWVASGQGLYRFVPDAPVAGAGPERQPFQPVPLPPSSSGTAVVTIAEGPEGRLYCASSAALFEIEPSEGKWKMQPLELRLADGAEQLPRITRVAIDGRGTIWLGTPNGLYQRTAGGATNSVTAGVQLPSDDIISLLLVGDRLLLGTTGGLVQVSTTGAPQPRLVFGGASGTGGTFLFSLATAPSGRVWIGTGSGLVEVTPDVAHNATPHATYARPEGLPDQHVTALAWDRDGGLWVGGESGGVSRIDFTGLVSYDERDGISHPRIGSIFETLEGELCVVSGDVIHRFNGMSFEPIRPQRPPGFEDPGWGWNQIYLQDHRGEWWLPSRYGLLRYPALADLADLAHTSPKAIYTTAEGLHGNSIFRLYEDRRHDIWIGTINIRPQTLTRWRRVEREFQIFGPEDGLPIASPTAFAEDRAGNLWIGFYTERRLARYRNGAFELLEMPASVPACMVRDLHLDSQGRLWVATSRGGVIRIDDPGAAHPSMQVYDSSTGLSTNATSALTEDGHGAIYIGTFRGLDRLDPSSGRVTHLSTNDGLANSTVNVAHRDHDGQLWFGTLLGLSELSPAVPEPRPVPTVLLTGVMISGLPQPVAELGQREIAELVLPPDRNHIQIDYSAISLANAREIRYQYFLEGADRDWSAPTALRRVHYARLAPGRYQFHVRAVASGGSSGPDPAVAAFLILEPLWRRTWFLVLSGLVLALGLLAADRYRTTSLRARERELAQRVAEQTADLRQAEERLLDANRTLEQRVEDGIGALREAERMAAYGRLVAGVAHEVRHPIFALQAASHVLTRRLEGREDLEVQLQTLELGTRRMGQLMDDLLEFARPQALQPAPVAPAKVLAEAADIYRAEHGDSELRPTVEIPGDLPDAVLDQARIVQVLVNLMENAHKHAKGATRLRLRAEIESGPEGEKEQSLLLLVSDDGAGIGAEHLPQLFDPFYTTGKGTGLGLAIVHRIVSDHGGTITVDSDHVHGTSFLIRLPLAGL